MGGAGPRWGLLTLQRDSRQRGAPFHPGTGTKADEALTHLAAHRLLVLPAALLSALVGLDAEAGPASGAGGLTAGAAGFLLVLEQLHQQVKLQTAGRLAPPPSGNPPSLSETPGKVLGIVRERWRGRGPADWAAWWRSGLGPLSKKVGVQKYIRALWTFQQRNKGRSRHAAATKVELSVSRSRKEGAERCISNRYGARSRRRAALHLQRSSKLESRSGLN